MIIRDEVLVGVPEQYTVRKGEKATNALLAMVHDRGSPIHNIPARPFMEPGVLRVQDDLSALMGKGGKAALKGDAAGVHRALVAVGLKAQASIRARINEGIPPPLKPRTIAARKRRGRLSTKPLVDKGELRNSINFEIRRKNATS